MPENVLYYGDNLDVLRRHLPDASVDLTYLDPPFNSNADYNAFFAEQDGTRAASQIKAFKDTWTWDQASSLAYHEFVVGQRTPDKARRSLIAFRDILGDGDLMAYIAMMAPRLVELHRVLKPTGSLYLHCDPTASHYLKLVLDSVFGGENFLSEIIWKRTGTHLSANRWGPVHDVIFYYAKNAGAHAWNRPYVPISVEHGKRHYRLKDAQGRVYEHGELTAPGTRNGRSGATCRGFDVTAIGRHWMTTVEKLDVLHEIGKIYLPPDGGWPRLIRFRDESKGSAVGDNWVDIPPINTKANERLGYPTQKPLALLERIIRASSNPGDVILDPFCGCGTAVEAAEKLGRRWLGIDITQLSITLIKKRLHDAFDGKIDKAYKTVGEPTDVSGATYLAQSDPYQFQWWALGLVMARPLEQKKGADKGIDGRLYFHDDADGSKIKHVIFSVKAGKVGVSQVRDLRGTLERERAEIGVFLSLQEPTAPMRAEAAGAGYYDSSWGTRHPRLQLRTIGELLGGATLDLPPSRDHRTFKKAPKSKPSGSGPSTPGLPFGDE